MRPHFDKGYKSHPPHHALLTTPTNLEIFLKKNFVSTFGNYVMSLLWKLGTATSLRNVDKKKHDFLGSHYANCFWVLHKSIVPIALGPSKEYHVLGKLLLVIWGPSMTHMP